MKILNLYAGIGGNRKLWGDEHEVTAVEFDPKIASIYQEFFPNDKVIVGDAHEYLLNHFEEFDFIWSSPPCPSHSRVRKATRHQNKPIYPDMKLYEEILLLQGYFKGGYCVENVRAWYKPLIEPQEFALHWFWCNFKVPPISIKSRNHDGTIDSLQESKGFDLNGKVGIDKRKTLRNCVEPETGLHILNTFTKHPFMV
jgi:DNA (cytosine-5)-methyltransferase 1